MGLFNSIAMDSESAVYLSNYLFMFVIVLVMVKCLQWLWDRKDLYILSFKLSGPMSFPFIGSLPQLLKLASRKEPVKVLCEFIGSYQGPIQFWMGPDFVIFLSDPEDVEVVLKSKSVVSKPPRLFNFANEMLGYGILTATAIDGTWKTHRKIMSPSFNTSVIKSYHPIIQRKAELFIRDFEKHIGQENLKFSQFFERHVADVMAETLLDYKTDFREGKCDDIIHAVDKMTEAVFKKIYKVWYYIDFFYNRSPLKVMQVSATNTMNKFAEDVFNAKLADIENDKEMPLSVIQSLMKSYVRGEINKNEVLDEVKTIWAAGSDTMIIDTCWLLLMLGIHKDKQEKAFQEIKDYYKYNKDAPVEIDDLQHFPYVEMCIKEVLRLFPVAPVSFRYITEEIELKHRNITIPPNTAIGLAVMYTHRNPNIWKNPEEFIPERFTPEECNKRHQYAYYPFSSGNRNCIGQRYGMHFMKTIAIYFLKNFEIHSDEKLKDIGLIFNVNVKHKQGFKATFTKRKWL